MQVELEEHEIQSIICYLQRYTAYVESSGICDKIIHKMKKLLENENAKYIMRK
jgi:uncharacterized membrane protein